MYQKANRRHKAGGSLTHSCLVIEQLIRRGGHSICFFLETTDNSPSHNTQLTSHHSQLYVIGVLTPPRSPSSVTTTDH